MLTIIIITQNGVAPIHSAVYLELDHMVELLINCGAQVNLKMKVGEVTASGYETLVLSVHILSIILWRENMDANNLTVKSFLQ